MILLPDIDWVEIPGGDFIYQEGERRSLPTFYMARYPVTNVQYQTFIDAGGYGDQRWWRRSRASRAGRIAMVAGQPAADECRLVRSGGFQPLAECAAGLRSPLADRGRMGACGTRTGWARVSLGRGVPDGLRQYRRKGTAKPASGTWRRRQRSVSIHRARRARGFSIWPATSGNGALTRTLTPDRSKPIRAATGAWGVVVRGTTSRTSRAARGASGAGLTTAATTGGFAWFRLPSFLDRCSLPIAA
jgi:hypothetical protein